MQHYEEKQTLIEISGLSHCRIPFKARSPFSALGGNSDNIDKISPRLDIERNFHLSTVDASAVPFISIDSLTKKSTAVVDFMANPWIRAIDIEKQYGIILSTFLLITYYFFQEDFQTEMKSMSRILMKVKTVVNEVANSIPEISKFARQTQILSTKLRDRTFFSETSGLGALGEKYEFGYFFCGTWKIVNVKKTTFFVRPDLTLVKLTRDGADELQKMKIKRARDKGSLLDFGEMDILQDEDDEENHETENDSDVTSSNLLDSFVIDSSVSHQVHPDDCFDVAKSCK